MNDRSSAADQRRKTIELLLTGMEMAVENNALIYDAGLDHIPEFENEPATVLPRPSFGVWKGGC